MERHPDSAPPGFPADPAAGPTVPRRNWLHRVVIVLVAIVVLAVAAGTFFLSYPGVHAIALQGGVSPQLARIYPGVFDAVLVIACVAAVMLRDARWWARCWAWLVAIVMLAAIGVTDVLHAMSYGLQRRPTEGVVAAAPVAAVLLAFSLFLTMLRQTRPQPSEPARGHGPDSAPDGRAAGQQPTAPLVFPAFDAVPVLAAGAAPRPPAPPIALPAGPTATASDDGSEADSKRAPEAFAVLTETREPNPTLVMPAVGGETSYVGQDPGTAATREEPALTATDPVPAHATGAPESQDGADAPTAPVAVALEATTFPAPEPSAAPTVAVPVATPASAPEAPAEPTVEAPTGPVPGPEQTRPPAPTPSAIRYASSAAAEQFADEDWEAEVDPALAGQVYPVLTSDPDIEVPPHQPGDPQDLEDDAPPFATAPFASVPRLNRVRVTPTPPTDETDE